MVPCEVSAPSANLDSMPHSSALSGPTLLSAPLRDSSVEDVALLIVGGI